MPDTTVTTPPGRLRRIPLGLRYMVGAAFFFSLMSLFVKLAGGRIPSLEIVLARCVVVMGMAYTMLRRAGLSWTGTNRPLLIARGVFGFAALSLFFFAITRLPLGDVTTIQYTSPVYTALIAALLLRERSGRGVLAGIALSLTGVLLVAQPSFLFGGVGLDPVGAAAVLGSAVLSGFAYVFVRKLRETEDPLVVVFWFAFVAVVLSLPVVLTQLVWPTPVEWLYLLGVGVTAHIAQVFLTRGLHLEAAGRATAVGYLQIVFAFAWGLLFFGDVPDVLSLLGAGIVVMGVLVVARRR